MKPTIAVIGVGTMGSALVRSLAKAGYRMLLADVEIAKCQSLYASIKSERADVDLDMLDCSREASWEADVVIPAIPAAAQADVAKAISDVVTGKIIVSIDPAPPGSNNGIAASFEEKEGEALARFLPYSKIVRVSLPEINLGNRTMNLGNTTADCHITGSDNEAVESVQQILRDAGFNPVVPVTPPLISLTNR